MGHIERRMWSGKASYRARYRGPAGRERSKSFRRKADAERWLTEIEHAKARGTWTDPALGRTRCDDWLASWWATTTNLRPTTRARDEMVLRLLRSALGLARCLWRRSPRSMSGPGWPSSRLVGWPRRPCTKTYQVFSKVMGARRGRWLSGADALPQGAAAEGRAGGDASLTPAEIIALSDAIRPLYRTLVLVGAYGGLRIGELAGLRRARRPVARHGHRGRDRDRGGRQAVLWAPEDPSRAQDCRAASVRHPRAGSSPRGPGRPEQPRLHRAEWGTAAGNGVPSAGLAAGDQRRAWTGCASTTCGTPPSRSGSPPARAPRRLPPWPVTPRSASPWTATATCIPTPMPRCVTASTPCTRPRRSATRRSSTCPPRSCGPSGATT